MPKNMLFSLKIVKIAKRWGFCPQTPLPPAAGGSDLRPHISHPILWMVLSASAHKAQTLSESTKIPYFLVIIAKCTRLSA